MKELKKTRSLNAVELKGCCKGGHSVWRLMFIPQPSPLLEQDAEGKLRLKRNTTGQLPHFCASPRASETLHWGLGQLLDSVWGGMCTYWAASLGGEWAHLPPLLPCYMSRLLGTLKSFPLTSAKPVKPKWFMRISNPCFLTKERKVLEILGSYIHSSNLLDLCITYQSHFGSYSNTIKPNI